MPSTQELPKIERADLLRRIAIREQAGRGIAVRGLAASCARRSARVIRRGGKPIAMLEQKTIETMSDQERLNRDQGHQHRDNTDGGARSGQTSRRRG